MITTIPAMDLRRRAGELLARVRFTGARFVIEKNGEAVAALVGVEDLQILERVTDVSDRERAMRQQALDLALRLSSEVLARRGGHAIPDTTPDVRALREES